MIQKGRWRVNPSIPFNGRLLRLVKNVRVCAR